MDLVTLYCHIDDFVKNMQSQAQALITHHLKGKRGPQRRMSLAKILTIIIYWPLFLGLNY